MNIDKFFFNSTTKISFLQTPEKSPILLEPKVSNTNLLTWIEDYKDVIEKLLLIYGGVLLRNFNIHSVIEFKQFAQKFSPQLLDYTYRSTPRTALGGNIYTATEYPSDRSIPLHNENSYSHSWPSKLMFFCVIPATQGGETPIADSRNVLRKIDSSIVTTFDKKKLMYIRNYTKGVDLSWEEVFQTSEKTIVENYCKKNKIQYEWLNRSIELRTKQLSQATWVHPINGQKVWFNQAHLFHPSSLLPNEYSLLAAELGEENLPRNVVYGDETPIAIEALEHIRNIYAQESIIFSWQFGDLLILDNLLMAHGRTPYQGERKIVVAMV